MKSEIETRKPLKASRSEQIRKTILHYEAGKMRFSVVNGGFILITCLELSGSVVISVLMYYMMGYPIASQFIFVSYEVSPNKFDKGVGDYYFVFFWAIMFTFLRASFIKYGYLPIANYLNIGEASKRQRVAEQFYILAYYVVFGSAGMVGGGGNGGEGKGMTKKNELTTKTHNRDFIVYHVQ